MKRHVFALLCMVNVLLAVGLAVLWFQPDGTLRNAHWQAPEPVNADYLAMVPALPDRKPVETGRLMAMLERPLFSSTRRPPPPAASEAPVPADNLSTARLLGIFESAQTSGAILQVAGKNRRVRLNESVDGWVLQSVQKRAVTFASGDQTRTLSLVRALVNTGPSAMVPAAPMSPPPQALPVATGAASATTPAPAPMTRRFGP